MATVIHDNTGATELHEFNTLEREFITDAIGRLQADTRLASIGNEDLVLKVTERRGEFWVELYD